MKILHIIPSLMAGGAEKLVLETCIQFNKIDNIETKIITFKKDNYFSHLSNQINWEIIPSSTKLSIYKKNIFFIENLEKEINAFQPNIIHTHLWEAEIISRCINYKKASWFSHFHDNMLELRKIKPSFHKKDITDFYERRFTIKKYLQYNNKFICISKDTLNYAKKVIPKALQNNIYFLPNAINYNNFHREKKQNFSSIKLINIGTFVNKKNQTLALEIVKNILQKGFNVELTFLGDGPEKHKLIEYSIKLGIQKRIHFAGIVKNVNEYLWKSNIYLHTATYEPFGLVLIEAMAAGIPVVSLDGKGNQDFINHKENGYIFKKQDPKVFADTIIKLFENKKLCQKISTNGQKTAENHDIKNYVSKLLKIYKDSISSKN